jgi:hypothetical protein
MTDRDYEIGNLAARVQAVENQLAHLVEQLAPISKTFARMEGAKSAIAAIAAFFGIGTMLGAITLWEAGKRIFGAH